MVLNYIAILVVAVVSMALGMLWWSTLMFGPAWQKSMNLSNSFLKKHKKDVLRNVLFDFAGKIIMGVILSYVVQVARVSALQTGALLGVLLWAGIIVPLTMGNVLWEGKSVTSWSIGVAYNLVIVVLATAVLAAW